MKLSEARLGQKYIITETDGSAPAAARLRQLGFVCGALTVPLHCAPISGEPRAYYIKGTVIALRKADAESITVVRGGD